MKILLVSIGTRGDMEPFLAVGKILSSRGHEVACAFPDQFEQLARDVGFQFFGLGSEFLDMIQTQKGMEFIGSEVGFWRRAKAIHWFLQRYNHINENQLLMQKQAIDTFCPERVVHHSLASYPVVWGRNNPDKSILLSTVPYLLHPTHEYSHILLSKNWGRFLNKLSYPIVNFLLTAPLMGAVNRSDIMEGISRREIDSTLLTGKTLYTVSPSIFSKPDYWPKNAKVIGFPQREKQLDWKPSGELGEYLLQHEKILFVTFGSMTNAHARKKTDMILNVLSRNNIPAIINTFAGGLSEPDKYDKKMFYFTNQIPYDYIFPKVHATVHHGGAGTTHTSLQFGKPSLIIPHIMDQFFWNKKNQILKTGPLGMKISKLREENFEEKVLDLWLSKTYKINAQKLSKAMAREDFRDDICDIIES